MTDPERQLIEAQACLTEETCRCGAVPVINYEPGCTWIECGRCKLMVAVPDFDIGGAVAAWMVAAN